MKEYSISGDTLQKILNFLANEPYVKVYQLVQDIRDTSKELGAGGTAQTAGTTTETSTGSNGSNGASASNGSGQQVASA